MATIYSPAVLAGLMPDFSIAGVVLSRFTKYTQAAAITVNDILQMIPVPANCRIIDVQVWLATPFSSPGMTINVGDGGSAARYFAAVNLGSPSYALNLFKGKGLIDTPSTFAAGRTSRGKCYDTADTIDVVFLSGLAAGTSAKICMNVLYCMQGSIADEDY